MYRVIRLAIYRESSDHQYIESLDFNLIEAENLYGDYYFINQWLKLHDYKEYDYICFLHDDTYIADYDLLVDIVENKCELFDRQNNKSEDLDSTENKMYVKNKEGETLLEVIPEM